MFPLFWLYFLFILVPCSTLSRPANAMVALESDGTTTRAVFECKLGSTLKGESTVTCRADGTWDFTEPSCGTIFQFHGMWEYKGTHMLFFFLDALTFAGFCQLFEQGSLGWVFKFLFLHLCMNPLKNVVKSMYNAWKVIKIIVWMCCKQWLYRIWQHWVEGCLRLTFILLNIHEHEVPHSANEIARNIW